MEMPEEIAKIINKYGDYIGVLKNGTQEEQDKVSHCINDLITAKKNMFLINIIRNVFKYLD